MGLASVPGALWLRDAIDPDLALALLLFAGGAVVAGFVTALIVLRFGEPLARPARIALAIALLGVLTGGFDSFFLYLHYIAYYVQWWPDAFTLHWFFTAVSTFLGVSFYFASIGAPMLIPLGLPTVLGFGFLIARR